MTAADNAAAAGAAVVVAGARLVPLPLVDDWIASLSRRQLVSSILARHHRTFPTAHLAPLYNDGSIWGLPFRFVKSIVMFPIKKVIRPLLPFLLARDLALAIGRTLALAHVLERQLGFGMFSNSDDKARHRDEAARLRKALDGAWSGIDKRLITDAVKSVWKRVKKEKKEGKEEGEATPELSGFFFEIDQRVDRLLADLPIKG